MIVPHAICSLWTPNEKGLTRWEPEKNILKKAKDTTGNVTKFQMQGK